MHSSLAGQVLGYWVQLVDWLRDRGYREQSPGCSLMASEVSEVAVMLHWPKSPDACKTRKYLNMYALHLSSQYEGKALKAKL